jgi:hypothetical protein
MTDQLSDPLAPPDRPEQRPPEVGSVWKTADGRMVRVVAVNDRRIGIRNVATARLSYVQPYFFHRAHEEQDRAKTAAERTLKSIATMLGWENVPPQHVLEAEIAALKARAKGDVAVPARAHHQQDEETKDALSRVDGECSSQRQELPRKPPTGDSVADDYCVVCGELLARHFSPCRGVGDAAGVLRLLERLVGDGKRAAAIRVLDRHLRERPDDGRKLAQSEIGDLPAPKGTE